VTIRFVGEGDDERMYINGLELERASDVEESAGCASTRSSSSWSAPLVAALWLLAARRRRRP
jgi:MYXO-CTERM domain-containing protein